MVSLTETEINLFGKESSGLNEIEKLASFVNSGEKNKLDFAKQIKKNKKNNLAVGIGLYILGDNEQAVEKLKKAPDCKEKHMYLAFALRSLGLFDDAITSLNAITKKQVDPLTVTLQQAYTFRQAGQFDKAAKQLQKCKNYEKVSADYHFQLGRLEDAQGKYETAMENYELAVELDPLHKHALFHLAYAYDLRGDEDAAIDYYKQILKITPTHINSLLNLAVLYEDKNKYEKALKCVDIVLRAHPNHKKAILFKKDIESSKVMIYDEEKEKRRDKQTRLLEIPITDFELSVRSRNCLKKMNIITIGDLLNISEAELLSYKNFGETSLVEVKKILDSKGLTLGMALEERSDMTGGQDDPDAQTNEEMLNKSIDDLELSVRAKRCLTKLNLRTFGEVIGKTEAELLGCKNFGVTSLNEIKDRLSGYGLNLRKLESE